MDNIDYSPKEYFDTLKNKIKNNSNEKLQQLYDNSLILLNKYNITGQVSAMKKLIFQIETIEKEFQIVDMGIDTFVYRDDIEYYIDKVSKNVVKIIELENYEREIPDEVVDVIASTKSIFDKFYVVFTDYTGKVEREISKVRRDKDPILFGTFQNQETGVLIDRFYYLGDWIDEYCDLTLDKMLSETKAKTNKNIAIKISTPRDVNELKKQLSKLDNKGNTFIVNNQKSNKSSMFQKIKSVILK